MASQKRVLEMNLVKRLWRYLNPWDIALMILKWWGTTLMPWIRVKQI